MVTSATALTRTGLSDWLVQRVSAVIILLYVFCHAAIFINNPHMDYAQWHALFADPVMRVFSLITLAALCAHAWIGMWTVATDYLTTRMLGSSGTFVRFLFLVICIGVTVVYFIWGIMILWSV